MKRQQIQQMISREDDNGITIFYKLKDNFFDQNLQEEQIVAEIRQDPIGSVGRILLILTEQYSSKLTQVIQPLQDQIAHLLRLLAEERQKLQHSLDDNEIFKAIIDRLEEEKKESDLKLNQSIEDFQRSRQDIGHQKVEKEKIKSEAFKIFENYQQICSDYNQLKQTQLLYESQITHLKQTVEKLKNNNEDILKSKLKLNIQYTSLVQQKEELLGKLATKQEFIASIVDQSHKIQFFKHQDISIAKVYAHEEKVLQKDEKNELTEFNFNEEVKFETSSHASINLSIAHPLPSQMDEKFINIQASQKQKSKNQKGFAHSRKSSMGIDSTSNPKKGGNLIKKESKNVKSSSMCSSKKKFILKTVSSKNLLESNKKEKQSPSDYDEQRAMIEAELKKRIILKEEKINALETELMKLRNQFLEQRQNITIMEGQYEIQIDELNSKLAFVNSKLNQTYQSYINAKIQSEMFEEKAQELEQQLLTINCQHEIYCEQLRRRCKAYVIKRIDEVQQKYEEMKVQMAKVALDQLNQHEEDIQEQMEPLNLQKPQEDREGSEAYSYERLSNHFFKGIGAGFTLDLSSNHFKNEQANEIYIREHFEIQSDLGGFTQRLNQVKKFSIKDGAFTDRDTKGSPFTSGKDDWRERIEKKLKVTFDFRVCEEFYVPRLKELAIQQSESIAILPKLKKLMIEHCIQDMVPSRSRNMRTDRTLSLTISHNRQKKLTISNCLYDLSIEQRRTPNLSIVPAHKYNEKITIDSKCKLESQTSCFFFQPHVKLFTLAKQPYLSLQQTKKIDTKIQTDEQKQYQQTSTSISRLVYQPKLNLCAGQIQVNIDHNQALLIEALNTKKQGHKKSKTSSFKMSSAQSEFVQIKTKQRLYTNNEECKEINQMSTYYQGMNELPKESQDVNVHKPTLPRQQYHKDNSSIVSPQRKKTGEDSSLCLFSFQRKVQKIDESPIHHLKCHSLLEETVLKPQQIKEQKRRSVCSVVSSEVTKYLNQSQYASLCAYIEKNKVKIRFQDIVYKKTFKRPSQLTKKVIILSTTSKSNVTMTYILNSSKIYCLQTKKEIKFDRNKLINESNFMFGQSEVSVTRNGHLIISRQGKRNKLSGNLEDGDWTIDSYIICGYQLIE